MLPQKSTPALPQATLARLHASLQLPTLFKGTAFHRSWTGVFGFCAGCVAYHAWALSGRAGTLSSRTLPVLRPFRKTLDDESWKCVSMYRGRPRNPKLGVEHASQVGQDATILDIFQHKRGGTFLDLASNDAVNLSNSLVLEQRYNWTGVCVEPNPSYTEGYIHRTCRLVQAVVGPKEGERVNFNFRGAELSGAFGGIEGFDNAKSQGTSKTTASHYTVSVAKILRDFGMPQKIDYMSLDIEGAEAWTFESFPWETYTFLTITVERPRLKLRQMLTNNGYTYLCNHGGFGDELWVHESLPSFEKIVEKYGGRQDCAKGKGGG